MPSAMHWGSVDSPAPIICATESWNGLGFSAYQIWANRRADLTCLTGTPFLCSNGKRAIMASIRTMSPRTFGSDRMIVIGSELIDRLGPMLAALPGRGSVALALCLPNRMRPHPDAVVFNRQRGHVERALLERLGGYVRDPHFYSLPHGHAAGAYAIKTAAAALASHKIEAAVVGGVESYYDPDAMDALVVEQRIFDGEDPDAFIPGEGGCFFVLTRRDVAARLGWSALASVESAATHDEPDTLRYDRVSAGTGLSRAIRAISDRLSKERRLVDWWITDLTNEDYRTHEFALAFPRATAGVTSLKTFVDYPVRQLGDLGAATIPTAIAEAIEGFLRGDPDARNCLIHATSTNEERGAVFVVAER